MARMAPGLEEALPIRAEIAMRLRPNGMLERSPSLPAIRSRTRRSVASLPSPARPTGALPPAGVGASSMARMAHELLVFIDAELALRGLRPGDGERVEVTREVIAALGERLPSSQALLSRIQREYDDALAVLRQELQAAEARAADAWRTQQNHEAAQLAVHQEAERERARAHTKYVAQLAAHAAQVEARARAAVTVDSVLSSLRTLAEGPRQQCVRRALTELLPEARRRPLLARLLQNTDAVERSQIIATALQPPLLHGRAALGELGAEPTPLAVDSMQYPADEASGAHVEALLNAMPERERAQLGVLALRSVSAETRGVCMAGLAEAGRQSSDAAREVSL